MKGKRKAVYKSYAEPRTHLGGDERHTFCGKDLGRKHYIIVESEPTCERCLKAKVGPKREQAEADGLISRERPNPHPGHVAELYSDKVAVRKQMPDGTWEFIRTKDGKTEWFSSIDAAERFIADIRKEKRS